MNLKSANDLMIDRPIIWCTSCYGAFVYPRDRTVLYCPRCGMSIDVPLVEKRGKEVSHV